MKNEVIENISDRAWWVEVDLDNSDIPVNQHIQSISDKFFGLKDHEKPVVIYMRPNGSRLFFGEWLIAKGLPVHFAKNRETIHPLV